ncbi:MAG: helix-turn-helix domain-containing protein [Geminicoccaceae bacterium]
MPKQPNASTGDVSSPLLDTPKAAEYLGTSVRHVQNLVYHRRIPYVKVGRFVRFRTRDLDAWIDANTVPAGGAA